MKKLIIATVITLAIIIFAIIGAGIYRFNFTNDDVYMACPQDAKLCPDGSAVSRTGINCEFANCPIINSSLKEAEARIIAETACIKGGEALSNGVYNSNTKTWWFDANLNTTKPGCNPACVVSESTQTAEINWRCTGLIPPNN